MSSVTTAEAARTLAIAARGADEFLRAHRLNLPRHEDLNVTLDTATHWFYLHTPAGERATWDATWLEYTGGDPSSPDEPEYQEHERYICGTFDVMNALVEATIEHPRRVPGSAVDVHVNEFALHYLLPESPAARRP